MKRAQIAKDLQVWHIKNTDTIGGLKMKFNRVMKKHKIKSRVPAEGSNGL